MDLTSLVQLGASFAQGSGSRVEILTNDWGPIVVQGDGQRVDPATNQPAPPGITDAYLRHSQLTVKVNGVTVYSPYGEPTHNYAPVLIAVLAAGVVTIGAVLFYAVKGVIK